MMTFTLIILCPSVWSGMDKNYQITTHFPLANINVNACEGEVLAFDFNREVHYISCDESKKEHSDKVRAHCQLTNSLIYFQFSTCSFCRNFIIFLLT